MPDMTDSAPAPEETTPTHGGAEDWRVPLWKAVNLYATGNMARKEEQVIVIEGMIGALLLAAERRGIERAAKVAEGYPHQRGSTIATYIRLLDASKGA